MGSFSSTIKHYFNIFASKYRWQQLSEWCAQIFKFDLSQKQQGTERFWSFWMICRGLQNAEMPLCVCVCMRVDGKPQYWYFALEKKSQKVKSNKNLKTLLEVLLHFCGTFGIPFSAFVTLPSALAAAACSVLPTRLTPAKPVFRSGARHGSNILPTCQSLHLLPQQGHWESST